MALHSISEAHRLTGKARTTIRRDLAAGLLSTTTRPNGARVIETSELTRVYGPLQKLQKQKHLKIQPEPGSNPEQSVLVESILQRLSEAEVRAARAEGERDALRELADHAREDAAAWRVRADNADRLLTDIRTSSEKPKAQPWWRFGRTT
ncbi:hypothetical protein [uncultured Jannaschia sp.]|uniref:hypothetical protein n=1 Tax=uncultured Jannaschia sp. TaxID=293347 RepID=UPI00261866C6|nr:hypothetical protein [uncultured Jannaschia sp.]